MQNEKSNSPKRYLFLGISLLSALLAASVFFHKTDSQIYNLALSAPNSLPQKYVSFLKENERWKAINVFAELYNNVADSYTDKLSEEMRTGITEVTNSSLEAKEQRKTFSYWKKEGFKAVTLRKGDDAPQETVSKITSTLVDVPLGDLITIIDSGHKLYNNETEEIDNFELALSTLGLASDFITVSTAGTSSSVTIPTRLFCNTLKKAVKSMKSSLRDAFLIEINRIRKEPSLIFRYKSLLIIAKDSPEIAIWLLTIPNTIEQGERLWNLLSNSYSKKEMKNVIKQGTIMLTFYNNPEQYNSVCIVPNEAPQSTESSSISDNTSNSQTEDSASDNNANEVSNGASNDIGILNKTMDYIGKKKDEILKKNNSESSEAVIENKEPEQIAVKKKKKMFEESAMISSLEEIISALEIMSQQDRLSPQDLFFALCYGQQGLEALKQNKLHEFMSYRDT